MKRRKCSLRCCVLLIVPAISVLLIGQILLLSSRVSSSYDRKVVFIPRRHMEDAQQRQEAPQGKTAENRGSNSVINSFQIIDRSVDYLRKNVDNKYISDFGLIKTAEDQELRDEGSRMHAFNLLISDKLGFHRKIIDSRHPSCKEKTYDVSLPKASIIICYYNEAWSALLRTVHSVLDRTPAEYLEEIIIVDDSSSMDYWRAPIKNYIEENLGSKVRHYVTPERAGLIRARIFGASHASGEVLIFLDSHCEANQGWIQPLLQRVKDHNSTVAIPVIDIISADSLEYQVSPVVRGGFTWGLHFRWDEIPERLKIGSSNVLVDPIETPTMAGGLFAMNRRYFNHLGQYDAGMDIWGGENLELSFRVWQCGGRLEIIPCSRVGHIFRKRRPYGAPKGEDIQSKNSLRVVHVWMDEYKKYYFLQYPENQWKPYGDVSDRQALRQALKCKSFNWYLENVYPEQVIPNEKGQAPVALNIPKHREKPKNIFFGQIQHLQSGLCVQSSKDITTKMALLNLRSCTKIRGKRKYQEWFESAEQELLLGNMLCMDVESSSLVTTKHYACLMKCHGQHGSQQWQWLQNKTESSLLYNAASGKCLQPESPSEMAYLTMGICEDNPQMTFRFVNTKA